jgi:peptide/nickel transport system permease protein
LRYWVLRQASLLSGAFIAEYFFNWPGLEKLTLDAVNDRDLYLVMASLMMVRQC